MNDMSLHAVTEKYSLSDLDGNSDAEILSKLKASWGYSDIEKFEVIGRISQITLSEGSFYVLRELRSITDGRLLLYPLEVDDTHQSIFIGSIRNEQKDESFVVGQWVRAKLELSPKRERTKHNNPMGLKTVTGSLRPLYIIPEDTRPDILNTGDGPALERWLLDVCHLKHKTEINNAGKALQAKVDADAEAQRVRIVAENEALQVKLQDEHQRQLSEVESSKENAKKLSDDLKKQRKNLQEINQKIIDNKVQQKSAKAEFYSRKQIMEQQLGTLQNFIEQKAQILRDLDLIEQRELDNLLGHKATEASLTGHSFLDVFDADPLKAVAYIQSFMWQNGIVYTRKVLEDFFALVTTHDLIVLAGDSGSGKTNLIKSFAKAVGGKHVIIPVKPNWTSAEDLLGYYNPLEQKYLSTPFLEALFEATQNPEIPYFICLDEMNLARVEYYFADFLSLMEERNEAPEVSLYSDTEAAHLVSEARNFLALVDDAKHKLERSDLVSFLDILRDESLNSKLHELCGFREGDSLLKYHGQLRKLMSSYLTTPSKIRLPSNVRIIGAINVDETTHYLSPKILDRAHIMRFSSPLLSDWGQVEAEIEQFKLDMNLPISLPASALGIRSQYPAYDRNDKLVQTLVHLTREFLDPLGVEFGLRTIRQALGYSTAMQPFTASEALVLNNIVLHKVLPKLMFDGEKVVEAGIARKDKLAGMKDYLAETLDNLGGINAGDSCITELDRVIRNAESNDWSVNYWSR